MAIAATPSFPPRLDEFRDHSTVALLFAPVSDDPRYIGEAEQLAKLTQKPAFHDLIVASVTGADVVGLSDPAGALRSRFHAPAGVFKLVLLARNGAPVFSASILVPASRLEPALAAAMPQGR